MGGVAIDLKCRVLDREKRPIPGLYAVGELTGLAGINGKAALEGTFLGPCIVTGRVAARSLLTENPVDTKGSQKQRSCLSCHNMPALLASPREGFWHFESVHRAAETRGLDCRHCHSELSPYDEHAHEIRPQSLATSCVLCHVARE